MSDDSLKHSMIGEFDERLAEIDTSIRALASSKSFPAACAGHSDLVNSGLAQNRALGTLLRVERNRLMADGLTLASIDSLSGRGYTIAGRSSLIVAAGIATTPYTGWDYVHPEPWGTNLAVRYVGGVAIEARVRGTNYTGIITQEITL
jgi:hypothetical protein